ncbi:hypothetical protein ACA910_014918 [Epithemia clementina (nom. ined.)]
MELGTGSGLDDSGTQQQEYVDDLYDGQGVLSRMTFLIYLNDDFEGGSTKQQRRRQRQGHGTTTADYRNDDKNDPLVVFEVQPKQGSVLAFYHGYHPLSPIPEGALVTQGTKYVARTDVLYPLLPSSSLELRLDNR